MNFIRVSLDIEKRNIINHIMLNHQEIEAKIKEHLDHQFTLNNIDALITEQIDKELKGIINNQVHNLMHSGTFLSDVQTKVITAAKEKFGSD